jgi:hypothetical protein
MFVEWNYFAPASVEKKIFFNENANRISQTNAVVLRG